MNWCLRVTMGLLAVLCVLAGMPSALATGGDSLVTRPALDGVTLKDGPRLVDVGAAGEVRLEDKWGRELPLTGPGRQGSTLHLSSLPPGTYRLVSGTQSATFTIEDATFSEGHDGYALPEFATLESHTPPPAVPWATLLLLTSVGLALAALLHVRRHRRLGALAAGLTALVVLGAFALSRVPSSVTSSPPTIDGCRVLASGSDMTTQFRECVFDRLAYTFEKSGLVAAMAEVDAQPLSVCHEVVHQLGVYSWIRLNDPDKVLLPRLGSCNGAFYHGALYGASTYSNDDEFLRTAIDVCPASEVNDDPSRGDCYHGAGHAMALRFGSDTPRARQACDLVAPPGSLHNAECVGAVYMQHAVRFAKAAGDPAFLPSPPVPVKQACAGETDPKIIDLCYMAIAMAAPRVPSSAAELVTMCNAEPAARQDGCAKSIATEFRSLLPGGDVEGAKACMRLTRPSALEACVASHAHFSYDQFRDVAKLKAICATASLPENVCTRVTLGVSGDSGPSD